MNDLARQTGNVVPSLLSAAEARALTDRIRGTLTVAHDLIAEAYTGGAWTVLGYLTWDAYCASEFAEARMVRLEREQRREIVAEMRSAGMSTRAIASGLGSSEATVRRDLPGASDDAPDPVTGLDGKTYQPRPPEPADIVDAEIVDDPAPTPPRTNRRPLPDAFFDAAYDLGKTVDALARLAADERFPRNAEQVAAKHRSDLSNAVGVLTDVLNRLPEPDRRVPPQ